MAAAPMEALAATIVAVVEGDVSGLPALAAADHAALEQAVDARPPPPVSRVALVRVLEQWRGGQCTTAQVQEWASFVRWGFVGKIGGGPVRPLDIDYDAADEDLIVEIVGRFDEIGDPIDGEIDDNEQIAMLDMLRTA